MIDENKLIIRPATLDDVEFLATVIIEAEKSSTAKNGTANYFELSENDYRKYLIEMLEEDINGCELSISSFVVAEYDGEVVGAMGGWKEGENEDCLSSAILKANLFQYIVPRENLMKGSEKNAIIKDLQIEREEGAYQFEFSYVKPEFRGCGIKQKLNAFHINQAIEKGAAKIQTHVYQSNEKSIKANMKSGFTIAKIFRSDNPRIKEFYPDNAMVLMEKEL